MPADLSSGGILVFMCVYDLVFFFNFRNDNINENEEHIRCQQLWWNVSYLIASNDCLHSQVIVDCFFVGLNGADGTAAT